MLSGCVGYQEVQALPGWEKIYSPDRPQALEVPKGRVVPERPSVPVGCSGTRVLRVVQEWKTSQGGRILELTS